MKNKAFNYWLAVLAIAILAGFSVAGATAKKDKGPLRIMWWGSQTRHDRTLAVLEMYTKKNGVKFEPEFYGVDDYLSKLNILIASGDLPDLIQLGGNFPTYLKHLEVLNKYLKDGTIDTKDTDQSFIGITTLDGKTFGLSSGTNAPAIAYDPGLFKKAGVPLPTFKWTWDEWEKAVLTLHEKLGILGFSLTRREEFEALTTVVSQYGTKESLFLEPYRLKLNYKDDKYVTNYLKMVRRLTKAGAYPNPAQMAEIKDVEGSPLVKGEAAMAWLYSNQFVALSKAAKRPMAMVCLPRRTKEGPLSQTIMSSQMFCISKTSKHKMAAAEFLNFFANSIAANKILGGERGVPIMRQIRAALAPNLTEPEKEIYNYLTNLGKEASTNILLDSPVQTQVRDIYIRLSEEVVLGKTTPEAAAKRFKADARKTLERYSSK